jgi:ABC-type branched-subunit amino acid transport system ATPase component
MGYMSDAPAEEHSHEAPASALLTVENISVRFAGVKALMDVSFQVQPGELFAVIGPNGAGKTSLLNVLSRVYQPVAGRVTFEGRNLLHLINEQLGVTQILVEHDMALVMGIADRVLVLDFGRVIALGSPAEVQANPYVIKAYLGEEFGGGTSASLPISTEENHS